MKLIKSLTNAGCKALAEKKGARLVRYNENRDSYAADARRLRKQNIPAYHEDVRPNKQHPNGGSFLYIVHA